MAFLGCCCAENGGAVEQVEDGVDAKSVGMALSVFSHGEDSKAADGNPSTFQVVIVKTPDCTKLGLDTLAHSAEQLLKIQSVKPDGLIAAWNAGHPECVVKDGDSIVEVNGIHGRKTALYGAIARDRVLSITVRRGGA
eukprot:CAMPEP_0171146392 /NCGR_PEP_ID=MMETSP0766_2-20121228/147542_1 /TAXON_ID=439317 /ORGANISM="Gambierdiscus australes, Strain CAWD 149" /LENGTH=137 /DNA_ID=CAMNT_0011610297 /DNA_START=44 /DNA_END=457 /DNA_ORIENTATION=-